MGYNIKDTSALINSVITDAGRRAISMGNFNITYFQVGDSEVCYDCIDNADLSTLEVLKPAFNAQNKTPLPEKNQSNIKYPLYVDSNKTSFFGIPFSEPKVDEIYNSSSPRGFFTGTTDSFYHNTTSAYTLSSNWIVDLSTLNATDTFIATNSNCNGSFSADTQIGDYLSIWMDGTANCNTWTGNFPMLVYRIEGITGSTTASTGTGNVTVKVDRKLPDFSSMPLGGDGRVHFFPSGMTAMYDSNTPLSYAQIEELNFETNCSTGQDVKIWNMNIPWTESPAGYTVDDLDYNYFMSSGYTGTKEYLGYNSNNGQTDTDSTYYYNSYDEKINLSPSDQKSIAIIHYTNNALDNFYGEKFAQKQRDPSVPLSGDTGSARNFNIDIPWLMWHKSSGGTMGETFYTDPEGYDDLSLFVPHYIESEVNNNMNEPGIRYYHLWDTNTNSNGYPNRVGKVFPDLKIVIIDDDELIAAMSYKSNRNWTLPAPKLGYISPVNSQSVSTGFQGILTGSNETLWVTYRFNNSAFTESLHCNYYTKIKGEDDDCSDGTSKNVTFDFGPEFPYLNNTPSGVPSGFSANEISILVQKVTGDTRPNPASWVEISGVTSQISATTSNGYLNSAGLANTTFQITKENFEGGTDYVLEDYIDIPQSSGTKMNFGEEYFFYGTLKSDIAASIYVMNYRVNLGQTQYLDSSNPTWTGSNPYVSEVGLYNSDKDLMIISKVQSPEKRLGVQQYTIKFDF
jgi:hypothetical protein